MALHDWSPTIEVAKLDRDFEDILNHFMSHDWGVGKSSPRAHHPPAIESFVEPNRLVIRADLPGVDAKDVEVKCDDNVLTIKGSRTCASDEQRWDIVHTEIRYGSFERAISIPKGVKEEDISAVWCNGVLELTIPLKAVEVLRVPVQMPHRARAPERPQ